MDISEYPILLTG